MRARGLKTADKAKILAAFNQNSDGASFNQGSILQDLPPSLATDICFFMYHPSPLVNVQTMLLKHLEMNGIYHQIYQTF